MHSFTSTPAPYWSIMLTILNVGEGLIGAAEVSTLSRSLFSLPSPSPLYCLLLSHSISLQPPTRHIVKAVFWKRLFIGTFLQTKILPQWGKLVCLTPSFYCHVLLSFSLLHWGSNNRDHRLTLDLSDSDYEFRMARCRAQREPFVAELSCAIVNEAWLQTTCVAVMRICWL